MIRFCTCTGGSASSLENHKHQEGSITCKSCGGKLSVDGRSALSRSMPGTLGQELSRGIDPHLNWKTVPRGRQRVRRARTSVTGGIKKKPTTKCSKASEDLSDKDLKSSRDMSISESEKLGVNILGRRFSDTLESVPIKKRRFRLVRSPSPPPQSSPHSDDSDPRIESKPASYGEAVSNAKYHPVDINLGTGRESGQKSLFTDGKTNMKDLNGKLCDNADFSGISILAAVAVMNAEGSVSREHYSHGEVSRCAESHCLHKKKEDHLHPQGILHGETDIPQEVSTTLVLPDKESVGIELNRSSNNSTSSFQDISNKTSRLESSSRDDRFCWDLNTVWEGHNDGVLNSKPPLAAKIIGEVDIHDENLGNMKLDQDQMVFGNTKCASELANSIDLGDSCEDCCALKDTKVQENPDIHSDRSIPDHKEGKDCFSLAHGGGLVQEEHELEDASVAVVDTAVETMPMHKQESNNVITGVVSSPTLGTLALLRDSSLVTAAFEKEKAAACCEISGSLVETIVSSSPLVPCENASFDRGDACKPDAVVDQVSGVVYEKNTCAAPVADLEDHLAHRCQIDAQMMKATHLRSPQAEKHTSLCAESGNDKAGRCSAVGYIAEKTSGVMVDGNICKDMMNTASLSSEIERADALDGTDHDELSSGGACAGEHRIPDTHMKMQDNQCSVLSDETFNPSGDNYTVHIDSEIPVCTSAHMKPYIVDVSPLNSGLNSYGASKSYAEGHAISPGQVALEDQFDSDYYSDVSQIDTDQPTGMEKVECLRDDDYQYEDGEYRESAVSVWGEDGAEEGETEHVDYGSDNRELDIVEAACFPTSVPLEGKNGDLSDANHGHKNGAQAGEETHNNVSLPLSRCMPMANDSDSGSVKRRVKGGIKKVEMYAKSGSESGAVSDKGEKEYLNEGDASRRSSNLSNFRMKSSGWDLLPEDCRGSGSALMDPGVDSVSRNPTDASLDASSAREYMVGSSLRREPPRVERLQSSDVSLRKDKSYVRTSRSNDRNDLHSRVERNTGAPRSVGRGGSSLYLHGRGRHDNWVDSFNRCDPRSHDSHTYNGPSSLTHQPSRNAAAAAVAKLESNGFVVAPDGTILKAGGMGPAGRVLGRSAKVSSHSTHHSLMGRRSPAERDGSFGMPLALDNSRETSPDGHASIGRGRAYRFGPGMVSTGHKEIYHRSISDDSIDTSLPLHNQLTRREQSLSPHRRHFHHSRTRSPSRSRTRSPHPHTSPRVRNSSGMNAGLQRSRSPHRRSGLGERLVGYAPSSRNHTSPPQSSRWVDERKDLPVHFGEHNRLPWRSPPRRVFPRRHRFDPMDSPERMKSNGYSRSMHSGKIPEFAGFAGQSRYVGRGDDRRGYCVREYQYDNDGNVKHLRYDAEDGFNAHNPQPRSSEFRRGGSPRGFDRSIENQPGDSPRRAKEEKVHVGYVREGKRAASFKSFGVRDCDDNTTPRRRPS